MSVLPADQRVAASIAAAILKNNDPIFSFQPLEGQLPILRSKATTRIIFGGNRSGKSDIGAYDTVNKLLAPKQKFWCITVDEPLSIRVQQAKIHKFIPRSLRTAAEKPHYKSQLHYAYSRDGGFVNNKFTLSNGSSVEFKTYRQATQTFQGEDLDGIWFDECPPKAIFDEATVRLWDRNGLALITCTATEGITPWVSEALTAASTTLSKYAPLARKHMPIQQFSPQLKADIFYIWTTDNPHIDQEAVARRAQRMPLPELELRLFGIPSALQGRIYPTFSPQFHVRAAPRLHSPPHTHYFHVLDPHDRRPWVMGWYAYVHAQRTLYTLAEFPDEIMRGDESGTGFSQSDYLRFIKMKETALGLTSIPLKYFTRLIDPNKGRTPQVREHITESLQSTLARRGLYFTPAPDPIDEGHSEVREFLSFDPSEPFSEHNQPRFFIDPQCKNHIYQFEHYEFSDHASSRAEEDRGPKETPKPKNKDTPDLVRYTVLYLKKLYGDLLDDGVSTVETPRRTKRRSLI